MCGIAGLLYKDALRPVDPALLQRMTDVISHRGPDDEGQFIEGAVGLGSRRLSIVGLSDGHMPLHSDDRRIRVVTNGELYNHPSLRARLEGKGHTYRTHSDTETLIHAYREWGDDFVSHIHGMFAFALWDSNEKKLILGRDRLGIKPLYIHEDQHAIRFASEIKSILCDAEVPRALNPEGLNLYMSYLSAPAPYTLFKDIRQVNPGEVVIIQGERSTTRRFWFPEEQIQPTKITDTEGMKAQLAESFRTVIREHLLSDVPVGAFLSGGIDSSLIVALMHEQLGGGFPTFSIGFEGHALFDETQYARQIADQYNTEHHVLRLKPSDLLDSLQHITWQLDEPLADSSSLPVYFVSQLAAQHVKVVLSGDGGDEIFAGYRKYQGEYFRRYTSWMPDALQRVLSGQALRWLPESRSSQWMDYIRQVKKFFRGLHPDPFERHLRWAIHFEDDLRASFLSPDMLNQMDLGEARNYRARLFDELPHLDTLTRMLWVDLRHNLPADMLTKVDRMSMLHALEVRVPFLDHTFVEQAFSLPGHVKLHGKRTKWILKETFRDLLPPDIIDRRKHGFDVPVGEWFRHELREQIEDVTSTQVVSERGLFNPDAVQSLVRDHREGKRDYNNQLWILLSLELWQREYLDQPPGTVTPPPAAPGSPSQSQGG